MLLLTGGLWSNLTHCLIGLERQGTLGIDKPNDLPVSSFHLTLHPTPCCRLISQSTACPLLESILWLQEKGALFCQGAWSTFYNQIMFTLPPAYTRVKASDFVLSASNAFLWPHFYPPLSGPVTKFTCFGGPYRTWRHPKQVSGLGPPLHS